MVGILASASTGMMNSLLGKLTTLMGEEFAKMKNLRKEVEFICDEFSSMKDFLERLATVEKLDLQTKRWRDKVREMSYDVEDIIDNFITKIGEDGENSGIVRKTIRRLKTSRARHRIAGQIENIKKLVNATSERRRRYDVDITPPSNVAIDQRVTAFYANAADLVGMEGPSDELVCWLKDDEKQQKVISIVGFGGLGKTTLANVVYCKLKEEFDCNAFVSVSQKPDIPNLLGSLLSQLGCGQSVHDCELKILLDKLRQHLQKKRYLIIIDDLWSADAWGVIKCAFPENDLGSRIVVTTRIQGVAKECCLLGQQYIFNMEPLSNEDSRRLFFGRIFGSEKACPLHLKEVSVKVLKKCGGLPLAIISISSLLSVEGRNQKERWDYVQDSLGSGHIRDSSTSGKITITLDGMRQILNLSYKDLPSHLQTCLLYLGMYPEDYEILRVDLERQWMAEGFVSDAHGADVEKAARNYFNELVNRSLVQPVEFDIEGSVTQCKVHDMILDLILSKSADENFFTIVDNPQAFVGLEYKPRRLSLRLDGASNGTMLPENISLSQVRSVMIFGSSQKTPPLTEFKFLRVLHIVISHGTLDLSGLCKLYQLRYLKIFSWTYFKLPTKIRGLQQLQTLHAWSCLNFPSDIVHLPSLMYLELDDLRRYRSSGCDHEPPEGMGNMKSLRYLHTFDLGTHSLRNIEGLGELTNLRYLCVAFNDYPVDVDRKKRIDILCTSLGKISASLEHLRFDISGCIDGLMALSPPPRRLEKLHMSSNICYFSRVPNWMGELHYLRDLKLYVHALPKEDVGILAELPSLTYLYLYICRPIMERIVIYGRAFPALTRCRLYLSSMSCLTFQADAMPMLQSLLLGDNLEEWEENGAGPVGMEHLLALEEFSAQIGCFLATESVIKSVENTIRTAMNMHPNNPRIEIDMRARKFSEFGMF